MTTLFIYRGDTPTLRSVKFKIGGSVVSLQNKTLTLTVKQRPGDADEIALLRKRHLGGSDADALTGIAAFSLTDVESDITPGLYYYDIQAAWGESVYTVQSGFFLVLQDIGLAVDVIDPPVVAAITKMGPLGLSMGVLQ